MLASSYLPCEKSAARSSSRGVYGSGSTRQPTSQLKRDKTLAKTSLPRCPAAWLPTQRRKRALESHSAKRKSQRRERKSQRSKRALSDRVLLLHHHLHLQSRKRKRKSQEETRLLYSSRSSSLLKRSYWLRRKDSRLQPRGRRPSQQTRARPRCSKSERRQRLQSSRSTFRASWPEGVSRTCERRRSTCVVPSSIRARTARPRGH